MTQSQLQRCSCLAMRKATILLQSKNQKHRVITDAYLCRYLFTDKEKKEWERATAEGHKRKLPFIPQKFASLRQVEAILGTIVLSLQPFAIRCPPGTVSSGSGSSAAWTCTLHLDSERCD